jgi:glycosyltransferase involved in cell wall biosynthesis
MPTDDHDFALPSCHRHQLRQHAADIRHARGRLSIRSSAMSAAPARTLEHLGMNAVFLQPRMGGLETYVRELLPAMLELRPDLRVSLFVTDAGRKALANEPWATSVELVTHPLVGIPYGRAAAELTLVGALATRRGVDVLHSVALTAPLHTRAVSVITIADVTWLREPETVGRMTALLWRLIVSTVARRADRVITLSQAARREILEDLPVRAGRVDVVPCGTGNRIAAQVSEEQDLRERLGLGKGRVILAVSALSRHKNLPPLVRALALVRETHPDVVLVIPGNPTKHGSELEALARDLGVDEALRLPGWVDEADLEGLYGIASCFVFPSRREGFGMPILEAMARGVPVACSNVSAVPEVAGDAALYFAPDRPDQIAEAIERLLGDPKLAADLAKRGRERQRMFTWSRAAKETLAVYEHALNGS